MDDNVEVTTCVLKISYDEKGKTILFIESSLHNYKEKMPENVGNIQDVRYTSCKKMFTSINNKKCRIL